VPPPAATPPVYTPPAPKFPPIPIDAPTLGAAIAAAYATNAAALAAHRAGHTTNATVDAHAPVAAAGHFDATGDAHAGHVGIPFPPPNANGMPVIVNHCQTPNQPTKRISYLI
jgi:hypothetical protein